MVVCERRWREDGNWRRIVRFEDIQSFELLIDDCKRLKFLRFNDLLVEPGLDFILFDSWQLLVVVVEVPVQG